MWGQVTLLVFAYGQDGMTLSPAWERGGVTRRFRRECASPSFCCLSGVTFMRNGQGQTASRHNPVI